MLKIKEKRVLAADKKIDIKHAFMYNNEIVKVSLFYDRLIIQIDDSGIKCQSNMEQKKEQETDGSKEKITYLCWFKSTGR